MARVLGITVAARRSLRMGKAGGMIAAAVASVTVGQRAGFSSGSSDSRLQMPVAFVAESSYFPSPEKLKKGTGKGEDALFVSRYAIGVADGVGGWADMGIDSGEYSRHLMKVAEEQATDAVAAGSVPDPKVLMLEAHKQTKLQGSTTALIAVARPDGTVTARNLGDSALQVWRHSRPMSLVPQAPLTVDEASKLWDMRAETPTQQHYFNCPWQLSSGRDSDDPANAALLTVPVQGGDLVIAATDGVWDNLFRKDISAILSRFDFTPCHVLARMKRVQYLEALKIERAVVASAEGRAPPAEPLESRKLLGVAPEVITDAQVAAKEKECRGQLASIATMLAMTAQRLGARKDYNSPWALGAQRNGHRYVGGKLDDAAVVVALVTADPSAPARFGLEACVGGTGAAAEKSAAAAGAEKEGDARTGA